MPELRYTLRRRNGEDYDLTLEFQYDLGQIVNLTAYDGNKEFHLWGEELATVEQWIIDNPPEPSDKGWEPEHG